MAGEEWGLRERSVTGASSARERNLHGGSEHSLNLFADARLPPPEREPQLTSLVRNVTEQLSRVASERTEYQVRVQAPAKTGKALAARQGRRWRGGGRPPAALGCVGYCGACHAAPRPLPVVPPRPRTAGAYYYLSVRTQRLTAIPPRVPCATRRRSTASRSCHRRWRGRCRRSSSWSASAAGRATALTRERGQPGRAFWHDRALFAA